MPQMARTGKLTELRRTFSIQHRADYLEEEIL
jgi:hypothetical protein